MAEKRKTAAECRAELEAMKAERSALVTSIKQLRADLTTAETRYKQLDGDSWGGKGLIHHADGDLKEAELIEADQHAPRVAWAQAPEYGSTEKVLSKVTEKRIFIRDIGRTHHEQYHRDGRSVGGSVSYYGVIDVAATLKGTKWEALTPVP